MSAFTFKMMQKEMKRKDETGQEIIVPACEVVISFDMFNCKIFEDNGTIISTYVGDLNIHIPTAAREIFLKAWDKYHGANATGMWKEPVGTAECGVPTGNPYMPWNTVSAQEVAYYDSHAAQFMKEMKDLENKINGVEEKVDAKIPSKE